MAPRYLTVLFAAGSTCRGADATPWGDPTISVGCFLWGWLSGSQTKTVELQDKTVPACHQACVDDSDCVGFNFLGATSKACNLVTAGNFYTGLLQAPRGDITGPKTCQNPAPACTENAPFGWPAPTGPESFRLWATHYQPSPLMCWEKDNNGDPVQCDDLIKIEESDGVVRCSGLTEATEVTLNGVSCETFCKTDPSCPAWAETAQGKCFTGLGTNCFSGEQKAVSGGRYLRGDVRVLKKMLKKRILGLDNVFDKANLDALGSRAAEKCRNICVSSINCQYWQLLRQTGCWIENEIGYTNDVTYPLLSTSLDDVISPEEVIDGEYIQHFCPTVLPTLTGEYASFVPNTRTTTTTTTSVTTTTTTSMGEKASVGTIATEKKDASSSSDSSSDSSSSTWPWWAWMLLMLLLLCCLIAAIGAIMFAMGLCGKKPSKKKRERKPASPSPQVVTTTYPTQVQVSPPVQETYVAAPVSPVPTVMRQMPTYQPVVSVPQPLYQQVQPISYQQPTWQQTAIAQQTYPVRTVA